MRKSSVRVRIAVSIMLVVTGAVLASLGGLVEADTTPPPAPTGLVATAGDSSVKLTWNASTAADFSQYWVQYKKTADTTWIGIAGANPVNPTWTVTGLTNGVKYDFRVRAKDTSGNSGAWSTPASATPVAAGGGGTGGGGTTGDITIAAAGDVCDPTPATCAPAANLIGNINPNKVMVLGDNQYMDGTLAQYNAAYDKTWGAYKAKTIPVVGNHEAHDNYNGYCNYFGSAAHCPTMQYRVDLGAWSVIVLDSNTDATGGKIPTERLTQFQTMLDAANADGDNVLVAFHHPRWATKCSTCHGSLTSSKPFYDKAIANGVDVILVGHDHLYEAFKPMDGSGPAAGGIREFVVGTGGAHADPADLALNASVVAGSEFRKGNFEGVLKLTLKADTYAWSMVQADGTAAGKVVHSGSQAVR